MKKEDALLRIKNSRQALLEAINQLSEDDFNTQVEGIWNTKDVLGHIAAWETTLLAPLNALAAGQAFKAEVIADDEAWNLEQSAKRSVKNISEIRQEMEAVRQDLLAVLHKLSLEQWKETYIAPWRDTNTIIEMVSGLAWHEEEHTKSIQQKFSR